MIGLGAGNKVCQLILTSPKAERETRFQLILPVGNHDFTKNLTGHLRFEVIAAQSEVIGEKRPCYE